MFAADFATALFSYLLTFAICTAVLGLLWWQNGTREPATGDWFAGYLLHCLSMLAFGLRGHAPEFVPTIVGGLLVLAALILIARGLARFLRLPPRRWWLYVLAFAGAHYWFTYIDPQPRLRNMNIALAYVVIIGDAAWRLWRLPTPELRPTSQVLGAVLVALTTINTLAFAYLALAPAQQVGIGNQGSATALMVLFAQVSGIGLAVSLVLLVNRRLFVEVSSELRERRQTERALRESRARLDRAELIARIGHWEMDIAAGTFDASAGCEAIYGGRKADYDYATMRSIPLPEYRATIAERMQRAVETGAPYEAEFQIRTLDSGEIKDIHSQGHYDATSGRLFGVLQDITERKQHQRQLELMAHYDTLTGLPNRAMFADRLRQAIAQSQRRNLPLAVAFLDLDGFKAINDTHGHDAGDALLVELATRMKGTLREGDTLARIGGDEFIAVLVDLHDGEECERILRRLLAAASAPVPVGALELTVSASIGVALYPRDYVDADLLVRHADQAMYAAKQAGKNQYRIFGG